jgi:uncharacterized protein YoxC
MTVDLSTTNFLLGVMSVATVIELLAIVTVCIGFFVAARKLTEVLEDLKQVTATVKAQVESIDRTARWAGTLLKRFGGGAA